MITKREKLLGIMTLFAASIALVYNFIVEPLAKRWTELESGIRDKEVLLARHHRILRNKTEIERLHTEFTKFFQAAKLSPDEESAIALSSIEKLARGANVYITNIKPLTTKSYENYNKFSFRVTTESRISELTKFIYELQSSEQLLKIDRMALMSKERQPDTIKAVLHITKIAIF